MLSFICFVLLLLTELFVPSNLLLPYISLLYSFTFDPWFLFKRKTGLLEGTTLLFENDYSMLFTQKQNLSLWYILLPVWHSKHYDVMQLALHVKNSAVELCFVIAERSLSGHKKADWKKTECLIRCVSLENIMLHAHMCILPLIQRLLYFWSCATEQQKSSWWRFPIFCLDNFIVN